jgi:hypothetical protein
MSDHPPRTIVADPNIPTFPHLDGDGCCDCECAACTTRPEGTWRRCICPDCNPFKCGIHEGSTDD